MKTLTIIGTGPRGISVLERIAVLLEKNIKTSISKIVIVDAVKLGQGRIWNSNQNKVLLMNTIASEISAFSGEGSFFSAKPGAGPSFASWWKYHYDDYDYYGGYAPRKYYGEYLNFVWELIIKSLSQRIEVISKLDKVVDVISIYNDKYTVVTEKEDIWETDGLIITTGHSINSYSRYFQVLEDVAKKNNFLKFFRGNSIHEMDLSIIDRNHKVGVIGLGLSFFDVIAALTEGRGGQFYKENGSLVYKPSGLEPKLYCGSRNGIPILARGRNEKDSNYKHKGIIVTSQKMEVLRKLKNNNVNFDKDVWPLIEAEVNYTWLYQKIKNIYGEDKAETFSLSVMKNEISSSYELVKIANNLLNVNLKPLSLEKLAHPFLGKIFQNEEEWESSLRSILFEDIMEAKKGNISSPLKGALDVLRNIRDSIRTVVDFGGLTPESHCHFIEKYVPIMSLLSSGPPLFRLEQLEALIKAGIVSIVPPGMNVLPKETGYSITSNSLKTYHKEVSVLIDARIPIMDLKNDLNPLIKSLVRRGIFVPFINKGEDLDVFETGGVHVTKSPYNPIDKDGNILSNIFVLGIPTEHTRWFMQSGSSRPAFWIDFMIDADAIARASMTI